MFQDILISSVTRLHIRRPWNRGSFFSMGESFFSPRRPDTLRVRHVFYYVGSSDRVPEDKAAWV